MNYSRERDPVFSQIDVGKGNIFPFSAFLKGHPRCPTPRGLVWQYVGNLNVAMRMVAFDHGAYPNFYSNFVSILLHAFHHPLSAFAANWAIRNDFRLRARCHANMASSFVEYRPDAGVALCGMILGFVQPKRPTNSGVSASKAEYGPRNTHSHISRLLSRHAAPTTRDKRLPLSSRNAYLKKAIAAATCLAVTCRRYSHCKRLRDAQKGDIE